MAGNLRAALLDLSGRQMHVECAVLVEGVLERLARAHADDSAARSETDRELELLLETISLQELRPTVETIAWDMIGPCMHLADTAPGLKLLDLLCEVGNCKELFIRLIELLYAGDSYEHPARQLQQHGADEDSGVAFESARSDDFADDLLLRRLDRVACRVDARRPSNFAGEYIACLQTVFARCDAGFVLGFLQTGPEDRDGCRALRHFLELAASPRAFDGERTQVEQMVFDFTTSLPLHAPANRAPLSYIQCQARHPDRIPTDRRLPTCLGSAADYGAVLVYLNAVHDFLRRHCDVAKLGDDDHDDRVPEATRLGVAVMAAYGVVSRQFGIQRCIDLLWQLCEDGLTASATTIDAVVHLTDLALYPIPETLDAAALVEVEEERWMLLLQCLSTIAADTDEYVRTACYLLIRAVLLAAPMERRRRYLDDTLAECGSIKIKTATLALCPELDYTVPQRVFDEVEVDDETLPFVLQLANVLVGQRASSAAGAAFVAACEAALPSLDPMQADLLSLQLQLVRQVCCVR